MNINSNVVICHLLTLIKHTLVNLDWHVIVYCTLRNLILFHLISWLQKLLYIARLIGCVIFLIFLTVLYFLLLQMNVIYRKEETPNVSRYTILNFLNSFFLRKCSLCSAIIVFT